MEVRANHRATGPVLSGLDISAAVVSLYAEGDTEGEMVVKGSCNLALELEPSQGSTSSPLDEHMKKKKQTGCK